MDATTIRSQARKRLDRLSGDRLQVADDFLACLEERESREATEELLHIPGVADAFEEGRAAVEAGRLTPVEKLRRR
ncbi:hypothetical protein HQ560_09685 [bacterium]|nr:hypothetical protein [bacterium]